MAQNFSSAMGSLAPSVFVCLQRAIACAERKWKALQIFHEKMDKKVGGLRRPIWERRKFTLLVLSCRRKYIHIAKNFFIL